MINKIQLNNFQKHKSKEITFDPGVNVIIGESRAGKSSVFRALLFALLNESKRTNIVNWDAKFAEVIVDINGSVVTRRKGNNLNEYEIDGMLLKAFGVGVPDEVSEVILIDDINIERQHDSYFLISKTAGDLGKYFNQLVGLEEIDECFATTSQMQTKVNNDLKYKNEQANEYKEKMDELSFLPDCGNILKALQGNMTTAVKAEEDIVNIENIIYELEEIAKNDIVGLKNIESRFSEIQEFREEIKNTAVRLYSIEELLEGYPEEDIELGNIDEIMAVADKIIQDEDWLKSISSLVSEVKDFKEQEIIIDKELEKFLVELKKISRNCPTCGGTW